MSNERIKTYSSCLYNKAYTLWYMDEIVIVYYGASGLMYAGTWVVKTTNNFSAVKSSCTINSVTPTHSLHIRSVDLYSLIITIWMSSCSGTRHQWPHHTEEMLGREHSCRRTLLQKNNY